MALGSVDTPGDTLGAAAAARWIDQRLLPGCTSLLLAAEECFARLLGALPDEVIPDAVGSSGERAIHKLRVTDALRASSFWRSAIGWLDGLATRLDAYAADFGGVLERLALLSDEVDNQIRYLATELTAIRGRLGAMAAALLAFTDDDAAHCVWFELRTRARNEPALSLHRAPIEIAPLLRRALFEPFATTVLTSATLSVNGAFDYLHQRVGVDRIDPPERVRTLRVESPFDFARQAMLAVPADLPEPTLPADEAASHAALLRVLDITRGGTFVLFTSYAALNRAWFELAGALRAAGLAPLRQGELGRHVLLARFTAEPRAVLFATDSFWEGVDVHGDALRCVVITRLPFRVPTEPLEQARVDAIAARGGDPFAERALPQAVIKLKQGFGRLIRSRTDRGAVVLLDSRVARKRYGRVFLASLPPARQVIGDSTAVFEEMHTFFARAVRA